MTRRAAPTEVADRHPVAVAVEGLGHAYTTPEGALTVLDRVSLDVRPGEFVVRRQVNMIPRGPRESLVLRGAWRV